jgi:hypothetical protein
MFYVMFMGSILSPICMPPRTKPSALSGSEAAAAMDAGRNRRERRSESRKEMRKESRRKHRNVLLFIRHYLRRCWDDLTAKCRADAPFS